MSMAVALVLLLSYASSAKAIAAVYGSPCTPDCGNIANTYSTDLVCGDSDYTTTAAGQLMNSCLTCEETSLATNGTQSDEWWFLFNMKYTAQICIVQTSNKEAGVNACSTQCNKLQPVLETLWQTKPPVTQYDYCAINGGSFVGDAPGCAACLRSQTGTVILGNFIDTMSNACAAQPLATKQQLVSVDGSLFASSTTAQSTSTTTSTSSQVSTQSLSSTTSPGISSTTIAGSQASSPATVSAISGGGASPASASSSSSLSAGASAGIGIGVAFAILALAGIICFVVLYRRRQQKLSRTSGTMYEKPRLAPASSAGNGPELHSHEIYEAQSPPSYFVGELPGTGTLRR